MRNLRALTSSQINFRPALPFGKKAQGMHVLIQRTRLLQLLTHAQKRISTETKLIHILIWPWNTAASHRSQPLGGFAWLETVVSCRLRINRSYHSTNVVHFFVEFYSLFKQLHSHLSLFFITRHIENFSRSIFCYHYRIWKNIIWRVLKTYLQLERYVVFLQ